MNRNQAEFYGFENECLVNSVWLFGLYILFVYFYKKIKRRKETLNGRNQQNRSKVRRWRLSFERLLLRF